MVDGIPTSANYEQRKNIPSDFTINVDGENSQQIDYVVNVTVEKVAINNSQNLRLMFALTETDIPYFWMGQEKINFCERFMLPNASGTNLDFSESDILEFSFIFSIDTAWVHDNCELAVWIQNYSTREIQQGAKRSLNDFGGFPTNEAKLKHIYSPVTMCNNVFEAGIEVENLGSSDLTSIDIVYQINNEPEEIYNWTGNIPFTESLIINLPEINLSVVESDIFTVYLENPNNQADEFPYNDTLSNVIMVAENISSPVILVLKLDNFPEQTSWELLNSNDIVLYSCNNYTVPNVFITETFNLESNDCYSFKIYDENGDGLTGTGLYKLMNGTNIFQTGKAFAYMDEVEFGIELISNGQTINLSPGFQFVSSRIEPDNPDMTVVASEILTNDLEYIRNSEGAMLRKIEPNWVNGIGDWIGTEGYLIKINGNGQFTVEGSTIPIDTPIEVISGFQFISYLPDTEMDALDAFSSIIGENLLYVRSSEGAMLRKIGPNWVNGIGNCLPSEGYLVKMSADAVLVYPAEGKSANINKIKPTHFQFEGGNAADPIYTIYIDGLEIGDEIAVFDANKMVGASAIISENALYNSVPVFSTLNQEKGFKSGNSISIVVWDAQYQTEVSANYTFINEYANTYTNTIFPANDGEYSIINVTKAGFGMENANSEISLYPNPVNKILNIELPSIFQIEIINAFGCIIKKETLTNGTNSIDLSEQLPGIYFVKFIQEKDLQIKIIIIR